MSAHAVFGTTELLEAVLLRLPPQYILVAAHVCSNWLAVVEDSTSIRALVSASSQPPPLPDIPDLTPRSQRKQLRDAISKLDHKIRPSWGTDPYASIDLDQHTRSLLDSLDPHIIHPALPWFEEINVSAWGFCGESRILVCRVQDVDYFALLVKDISGKLRLRIADHKGLMVMFYLEMYDETPSIWGCHFRDRKLGVLEYGSFTRSDHWAGTQLGALSEYLDRFYGTQKGETAEYVNSQLRCDDTEFFAVEKRSGVGGS